MKNYVEEGCALNITVSGAPVVSGQVVQVGDIVGIATTDGAIGDLVAISTDGVYRLKKKTTDVIAQGVTVYWDNTAKEVTVTASTNKIAGKAWTAQANGDTTVDIRLSEA